MWGERKHINCMLLQLQICDQYKYEWQRYTWIDDALIHSNCYDNVYSSATTTHHRSGVCSKRGNSPVSHCSVQGWLPKVQHLSRYLMKKSNEGFSFNPWSHECGHGMTGSLFLHMISFHQGHGSSTSGPSMNLLFFPFTFSACRSFPSSPPL